MTPRQMWDALVAAVGSWVIGAILGVALARLYLALSEAWREQLAPAAVPDVHPESWEVLADAQRILRQAASIDGEWEEQDAAG